MILTKRDLAPIHCASPDPTRANIHGVAVEADGRTVATDGHVVATVGPKELGSHPAEGTLVMPIDLVKNANRVVKRSAINVRSVCERGEIKVLEVEGPAGEGYSSDNQTTDYPNMRQIVPSSDPDFEVAISAAVLEKIVATARQYSVTRKGELYALRFGFRSNGDAFSVVPMKPGDDDKHLLMVAMPVRDERK